jgi:hypothetical protein
VRNEVLSAFVRVGIERQDKDFIFNPWQLSPPERLKSFSRAGFASFSCWKENEEKKKSKLQLNVLTIIASFCIKLYKKPAN